jgi:hypothetical protein
METPEELAAVYRWDVWHLREAKTASIILSTYLSGSSLKLK